VERKVFVPPQPEEFWVNRTLFVVQGAECKASDAAGVEWFCYVNDMDLGELVGF